MDKETALKKAAADYKTAKKSCDQQFKGKERDACRNDAKAKYDQAMADAKGMHQSTEKRAEANKDRAEAAGKK